MGRIMNSTTAKTNGTHKTDKSSLAILESRFKYVHPPEGTNVAREFIRAFRSHGDKTILVDTATEREWTGNSILEQSARIASGLIQRAQVKPDDVVLMMCEHTGDEILFAVGSVLAGGALYSAGPDDGFEEQRTLCEIVRPDVIAASSRLHQVLVELKRKVSGLEQVKIVWIDDPISPAKPVNSARVITNDMTQVENDSSTANNNNNNNADVSYYLDLIRQDEVILLKELLESKLDMDAVERVANDGIIAAKHHVIYMLTSGSTGTPKVVPTTHAEFTHSIYCMFSATQPPDNGQKPLWPLTKDSVIAGDLPLDHGAGVNNMFLSLFLGCKLIVMPAYNAELFWQAVSDYKISYSFSSTSFTYHLLNRLKRVILDKEINGDKPQDVVGRSWDLTGFQYLACAGAKVAFVDLINEVCAVYDHIHVCQAYGATEMGHMSAVHIDECRKFTDSVGYLMPGMKAKVVDRDTGEIVKFNEMGELHVFARSKFNKYRSRLGQREDERMLADAHDSDGYYKTGDKAHFDQAGHLYIHGRFKDTLTLPSDWKILPTELEEIINKHPLVAQSAVIGLPDPDLPGLDKPRAFVRLLGSIEAEQLFSSFNLGHRDASTSELNVQEVERLHVAYNKRDMDLIAKDIHDFCAGRTAPQKRLTGGVRILEKFPSTGLLGKIDRKALKTMN